MTARDAYRDCGVAMRAAIARANAIRPRLKAAERAVLDAVLVLTASYSRLADEVYVADVADRAGVHESTARKALKKLAEEGVVEWTPRRGQAVRSPLALPLPETGGQEARLSARVVPPEPVGLSPALTGSQSPGETGSQDARRPRRSYEKVVRGSASPDGEALPVLADDEHAHSQMIWSLHDPNRFREEAATIGVVGSQAELLRLQLLHEERGA